MIRKPSPSKKRKGIIQKKYLGEKQVFGKDKRGCKTGLQLNKVRVKTKPSTEQKKKKLRQGF